MPTKALAQIVHSRAPTHFLLCFTGVSSTRPRLARLADSDDASPSVSIAAAVRRVEPEDAREFQARAAEALAHVRKQVSGSPRRVRVGEQTHRVAISPARGLETTAARLVAKSAAQNAPRRTSVAQCGGDSASRCPASTELLRCPTGRQPAFYKLLRRGNRLRIERRTPR